MVSFRPAAGEIPTSPGVYRFWDRARRVIYVGKATNLRSRLTSYFASPESLHPRTSAMMAEATDVDWVVVATEVEALSLEYSWIKEFDPRFNVKYRDDKSYPFLAVTMGEEFPRVSVVREPKRSGTRYFGPYAHAWAIRETMDELLRVFPMRSCRDGVFRQAHSQNRPCLLAHIAKCSAPCVGWVDAAEHKVLAEKFCSVLQGQGSRYAIELRQRMQDHAAAEEFESAARDRDRLAALQRVLERNALVLSDATDADVVALADSELEAGVQAFFVRQGRITGERGFTLEKSEDLPVSGYIERALQRLYDSSYRATDEGLDEQTRTVRFPREVLVNVLPDGVSAWESWFSAQRGSAVTVRIPQRGDKRALMETAVANAEGILTRQSLRRSSDLTSRSQAIEELQQALDLAMPPLRIECIDISNTQGQDSVASLVVFEDGLPKKRDYRNYTIQTVTSDDPASIAEVITRRFRNFGAAVQQQVRAGSPAGTAQELVHRAYPPGLILVDGGAPQVAAAVAALKELQVSGVPVAGLAKRLEELWLPERQDPVILPRGSEALYLVQRIRDEAHRTAIRLHRRKRGSRMSASALDSIPGLGPRRAQALLRKFGSVRRITSATLEELCAVPGIGPALAKNIQANLSEDR